MRGEKSILTVYCKKHEILRELTLSLMDLLAKHGATTAPLASSGAAE